MAEISKADLVSVATLPDAKRAELNVLETKTDRVYSLRTQLARFYSDNRQFIATELSPSERQQLVEDTQRKWDRARAVLSGEPVPVADQPTDFVPQNTAAIPFVGHRMRMNEMYLAQMDGKKVDDFIDWDEVDKSVDASGKSPQQVKLFKKLQRIKVRQQFQKAIGVFGELKNSGGDWDDEDQKDDQVEAYYKMRWGEKGRAARRLNELEQEAAEVQDMIDLTSSEPDFANEPELIDQLRKEYQSKITQATELTSEQPEAYLYALGKQLMEAKQVFDKNGTIVETAYVKAKKARILDLLAQGRWVFITGELGSGKTELAKHIARTELSKPHLARWEANPLNTKPNDPFERMAWERRRAQEAEALVISGHKNIEPENITAARSIQKAEAVSPETQVRIIEQNWQSFVESRKRTAGEGEINEQTLRNDLFDVYKSAYLESFKSAVETKAALAPLFKGMQEGRPVIIDELNAIPHHTLIMLNDYATRRVGDVITPPFPEMEPFTILEGFSVQTTGNYKPEDGKMYIGRQPLDAAFLSRLGMVSYDYLPMPVVHESPDLDPAGQREYRMQSELYHMLMARLINNDLSANLPEGTFGKVQKLATVARVLQDVFSGKQVGPGHMATAENNSQVTPQDVLKENVLSLRHLIPIIEQWKKDGFTRELDDYLFLNYISRSDARPLEKLYIYKELQIQGDFFAGDEWPASDQKDAILGLDIEGKTFNFDRVTGMRQLGDTRVLEKKFYSPKEVIEQLYGPAPERKMVAAAVFEPVQKMPEYSSEEEREEAMSRARMIAEIQERAARLKLDGFDFDEIIAEDQSESTDHA